MIFFCWIITFYNSWRINFIYYLVLIIIVSCNQSVGQICAVLFADNPKLSMTIATVMINFLNILGNLLVPMKKLHYSLQFLSEFSYFKLSYESMIISIYGFDRCFENEISIVLYGLGIDGQLFWSNIFKLIIIFVVLKFITISLLYFKINYNLKDNRKEGKISIALNECKVVF